jgi:hypothetical protein
LAFSIHSILIAGSLPPVGKVVFARTENSIESFARHCVTEYGILIKVEKELAGLRDDAFGMYATIHEIFFHS